MDGWMDGSFGGLGRFLGEWSGFVTAVFYRILNPTGYAGAHARFRSESVFNSPPVIKACGFNPSSTRIYYLQWHLKSRATTTSLTTPRTRRTPPAAPSILLAACKSAAVFATRVWG